MQTVLATTGTLKQHEPLHKLNNTNTLHKHMQGQRMKQVCPPKLVPRWPAEHTNEYAYIFFDYIGVTYDSSNHRSAKFAHTEYIQRPVLPPPWFCVRIFLWSYVQKILLLLLSSGRLLASMGRGCLLCCFCQPCISCAPPKCSLSTVFLDCIYQMYFSTVFLKCIFQLYFCSVDFANRASLVLPCHCSYCSHCYCSNCAARCLPWKSNPIHL